MRDYYGDEKIFPKSGIAAEVEDGDTFRLTTGQTVRMVGMDAPNRGEAGDKEAREELERMIKEKKVWLEYDRYQDDKYGRILGWVWVDCESNRPKFKPADYMHLSGKESREYLEEKAEGCKEGTLINKKMVEKGLASPVTYEKRGRLKYRL